MNAQRHKRWSMPQMEGTLARWYAQQRRSASQMDTYRTQAKQLSERVSSGAHVLEVAPGPGYLAIELARLGRVRVTGLDISRSFVDIAGANAREAGVEVDFQLGDVAHMPFEAGCFDLIVCQAAFKNFAQPVVALNEMERVLRHGGAARIVDMRREASTAEIAAEVQQMGLSRINALLTLTALLGLRYRAFSATQFQRLAAESRLGSCEITLDGIGMEVRLTKQRGT